MTVARRRRPREARAPQALQESILSVLALDEPYGAKIAAHVRVEHFDDSYRELAALLLDYRTKYQRPPGRAHLDDLIDVAMPREKLTTLQRQLSQLVAQADEGLNPEFVADRVGTWMGRQIRKRTIIRISDLFSANAPEDEIDQVLLDGIEAAQAISMAETPKVLTGEEFLALPIEAPDMLIEPWLETGNSVLVHAPADAGKTLLMLQVGIRLAGGRAPIFPDKWPVVRRARVLYVDGEMNEADCHRRLARFGKLPDWFHVMNIDHERKVGLHIGSLYEREHQVTLNRYIEACGANVIMLDNIFHLFSVSLEKDQEQWCKFANTWIAEQKSLRRSIVFLHHEPKGSPGASFGSVARELGVNVRLALAPLPPIPGDDSTWRQVNTFKGRELNAAQKAPFVARLSLDPENNRYVWTAEEAKPVEPGRPKTAEGADKRKWIGELIAEGKTNQEIADIVGVSVQYVRRVLKEGMAKETETRNPRD